MVSLTLNSIATPVIAKLRSLLCLGCIEPGLFYELLVRFYTETCWVRSNNKSLTHQGCSKRFVPADSARPVIIHHEKFHIYITALLNEISNK